jgi:hypothetical protein
MSDREVILCHGRYREVGLSVVIVDDEKRVYEY